MYDSEETEQLINKQQQQTLKKQNEQTGFNLFCKIYLQQFGEPMIKILICCSLFDQYLLMNAFENTNLKQKYLLQKINEIFIQELLISILFTADYMIRIIDQKQILLFDFKIFDLLAGPVSLIHDLISIFCLDQYSPYGFLLRFSKIFRTQSVIKLLQTMKRIYLKIIPLLLTMFTVFFIFSYLAKRLYSYTQPSYFGTLPDSMFTLFQVMTLDSWGSINRQILVSDGILPALFLLFFLFIMTYIFENLMVGLMLVQIEEEQSNQDEINYSDQQPQFDQQKYTKYKDLSINELFILDFVLGKYYDVIIFVLFVITLIEMSSYLTSSSFNSSLRYATRFLALAYEFFLSWIYLTHFFIVVWIKYTYKHVNFPNFSNTQGLFLFIHFISGPVAFCLDMYQFYLYLYIQSGHILRIFKILTLGNNRKIINKLINILPQLAPSFLTLFAIIVLLSSWATIRFRYAMPEYFGDFNLTIFTFLQIMTLDDWSTGIVRKLTEQAQEISILFIFFIIVSDFLILNIMTAVACKQMAKVSQNQKLFQGDGMSNVSYSFYDQDLNQLCIKESKVDILDKIKHLVKEWDPQFFYKLQNFDQKDKKITIVNRDEITFYYLLKYIQKTDQTQKLKISYKGKSVIINDLKQLKINENIELISQNGKNQYKIIEEIHKKVANMYTNKD